MSVVSPDLDRRAFLMGTAGLGLVTLGGCVTADQNTSRGAIVFLHGKTAAPNFAPFANAAISLRSAGFAVSTPEMPWSRGRYFSGSLSAAFDQIGTDVDRFRKAGFSNVLVGGHSIGGGIALGYGAARGSIDGLLLLAPGHSPREFLYATGQSLSTAREMVAAGRGAERQTFTDVNVGVRLSPRMSAADYLTWFEPSSDAEMRNTAGRIPASVPVFVAIGMSDSVQLRQLGVNVFDLLPDSPNKKFARVAGDHIGMLNAGVGSAVEWLSETFPMPLPARVTRG